MDMIVKLVSKLIITFLLLCSENSFLFASEAAAEEQVVIMCKDKERESLLALKQGFTNGSGYDSLPSWASSHSCCDWVGVSCSNRTGDVIGLTLFNLTGEVRPALLKLRQLRSLDLSYNDFRGNKIPEFISSLEKLKHLRLSHSNFSGDVPYQLGNLTNLTELDLSGNNLTSKDLTWLSKLSLLSTLRLFHNRFEGPFPSLSNLALLSSLDLKHNRFGGPLSSLSNLTLLSSVDLSSNRFEGPFPDLKSFSSLTALRLQKNKLTGPLPVSIGQFSNLETLDVSSNSLNGTVSEVHLSNLHNLTYLDLSFNSLVLNISPNWVPTFQLDHIYLARCRIGPHFPLWLHNQHNFSVLDISSNDISAEIPYWFWDLSRQFVYLNLSINQISGPVLDLTSNTTSTVIDICFNKFSGPLPLLPHGLSQLWLSLNMFSGSIQSICRVKYDSLTILDISKNQFSGEVPDCWENMRQLHVLNLHENNFSGPLPRSLGSLQNLFALQFRLNNLTGELPSTLANCTRLRLIDGGGNKLTGNMPMWMGTLTLLKILSLHQNRISGSIPPEMCRLTLIQVLDLSGNNISGRIPRCFDNFTSLIHSNQSSDYIDTRYEGQIFSFQNYEYNAIVKWKRQDLEYTNTLKLLKLVDLSSNKLVGNIPPEIYSLSGLISLNLSQNLLTRSISSKIHQMEMLESLDLSRNNLSGRIPVSLGQLSFLNVLDLSHNNLSGEIPKSTQLQSFNASAYAGNMELCGEPLPKCAQDNPSGANQGNIDDHREQSLITTFQSLFEEYFISVVLGYVVGFCVFVSPLVFNRSWRTAYYGYLNEIGDWLYVNVTLSKRRLIRYMNKSRN